MRNKRKGSSRIEVSTRNMEFRSKGKRKKEKTMDREREGGARPGEDLRPSSLASECR